MIDMPQAPTPALLRVSAWAQRLLWLVVAGWVLLGAMWAGLHFVIVPRIDELRPWLEQQASRAVGVPVRIGSVQAISNGLIPSAELRAVQLIDRQGRVALELGSVRAAISPRSLWSGGLEQLYIDSPTLDIRRAADGSFWIAGLQISAVDSGPSDSADWLLSQPEVAIRHGSVRWTDETRDAPVLELDDVDLVVRSRHLRHSLRLDASPPAHWGERLTVQGVFTHPLLSRHPGRWQDWKGQAYAFFSHVDWSALRVYLDAGPDVSRGRGSVRAWVDLAQGRVTGATADVLLSDVLLRQGAEQTPVVLPTASGRLAARQLDGGMEYTTRDLQFETADGVRWPGGNARLSLWDARAPDRTHADGLPAHGELSAERLDLAALSQVAQRLPLAPKARHLLEAYAPAGLVQNLSANWKGAPSQPATYAAQGQVKGLGLAAQADGSPGFQGLDVEFDLNEHEGRAKVGMAGGLIDLGSRWAEPRVAVQELAADVQWRKERARYSVSASNVRINTADAQGVLQGSWSHVPGTPGPGVLDMQGLFSRVELARVQRYLPAALFKQTREYLRDAVLAGTLSAVKLKLKGDLKDFPFAQSRQGEFRVSGTVANATYAYVPASYMPAGKKPWPVFTQLHGEIVIDQRALSLNGMRGLWGAVPLVRGDAVIDNLYGQATVSVLAQGKSPLADALTVVNNSAAGDLMDQALAKAVVTGLADYRVKLDFPLADTNHIAVQGMINLQGNDVQVTPATPRIAKARGPISFTEYGFQINGVSGRSFGGDVRIDGSLNGFGEAPALPAKAGESVARASPAVLRLEGRATAEGLRDTAEIGALADMGHYASGSASYIATVGLRGGVPDITVQSNLVGMALALPAPLAKSTDAALPLRLQVGPAREGVALASLPLKNQEQWQMSLGQVAALTLVRDISQSTARVVRGSMALGSNAQEPMALPAQGVAARVAVAALDVDAWSSLFAGGDGAGKRKGASAPQFELGPDYLPTSVQLQARDISWSGHALHAVNLKATHDGPVWRAQVESTEFAGMLEYRQAVQALSAKDRANAGRLYARLSRLTLGASAAQEVDSLLDEQPISIPALDVVVEDFELQGKKLGRLELEAVNQSSSMARETQREWLLKRFNVSTPEAVFNASGSWRLQPPSPGAAAAVPTDSLRDRRRTQLDFKLDIKDAGNLLARFGMKDVVRSGRGKIEGQVGWLGSPITLDYPSMRGSFSVNVEEGQFLKADPGIAKLLGVLSLQSLPRRLMFDFRDVFYEGFAFDYFRGDVAIAQGLARTSNLQMKGVTATVLMDGSADIAKETQAIRVVVVPEINAGSASLLTAAINPVMGLSSFLAQLVLRKPLIDANTKELYIDGTWLEPRITEVDRNKTPP